MTRSKRPVAKATTTRRDKRKRPSTTPTFFNSKAENIFNFSLKQREGVRERGITTQISEIANVIVRRGWQKLVMQPGSAMMDVVREFYANAREQYAEDSSLRKVLVRGQDVPYDSATINSFYDLPDIADDEYSTWVAGNPDYDQVLARLTFEKSQWKMRDGKPINFPRGQLLSIAKGWHYFICAKLLPTNHVSDVNRERALLNFAIQSRMTINVGKIIEESIINCCTGRLTSNLCHPSLIYELCIAEGVGSVDEEEQMPLPEIDDAAMDTYGRTTRESRLRREAALGHRSASMGASSSTDQASTSSGIQEQLDELKKGQQKIKKKLNYLMDLGLALTVMLKRTKIVEGVRLPDFPDVPEDSSDYTEDDEEEGSSESE